MKFGSLQVVWLEAFVEAAEHKRASAAATLGVKPSDITKYINNLGCWYGRGPCRMLLHSNVYPPALTADGEEFLPRAKEILRLIRAAYPEPVVDAPAPVEATIREIRVPPSPQLSE